MWDQKYAAEEYVYGTEPNDFLRQKCTQLPKGRALCIAAGEGRNAVWLAQQGFDVTAVDSSEVGLGKAKALAEKVGVTIETIHADLGEFDLGANRYDVVTAIFAHLPPPLRCKVHAGIVHGLKSGGMVLLEAYSPNQVGLGTGGPKTAEMMMTEQSLKKEFDGLEFVSLAEVEREIQEGRSHQGVSATVQLLAKKK